MMRLPSPCVAAFLVAVTLGCGKSEPERNSRKLDLLSNQTTEQEKITALVSARTTEFLQSLARQDASVAVYLDKDATLFDASSPVAPPPKPAGVLVGEIPNLTYYGILNMSPRPDYASATTNVKILSPTDAKTLSVTSAGKGILTVWRMRRAGWMVETITLNVPQDSIVVFRRTS